MVIIVAEIRTSTNIDMLPRKMDANGQPVVLATIVMILNTSRNGGDRSDFCQDVISFAMPD